jgi:hypothetical protein
MHFTLPIIYPLPPAVFAVFVVMMVAFVGVRIAFLLRKWFVGV